jgi:hypothetical protein
MAEPMIHVLVYDIDGVLANFTRGFTDLAASMGLVKEGWDNDRQPTWDFDFHVDKVWEHTESEGLDFWYELPLLATPDDVTYMNAIANYIEPVYVTGRKDAGSTRAQTQAWLQDHGFPEGLLILSDNKAEALRTLYLRPEHVAIIDDSPKVIANLRDGGYTVTVRDALYNKDVEGPRVDSVTQFIESVDSGDRDGCV